jgi:DNA gyrase subunit B
LHSGTVANEIHVVDVRRVTLSKPIPVYDATVPKFHNFALDSGIFVHNTARSARDKSYQEILPLKGKIKNAMKDKKGEALESEEVLNILAMIGFDPKSDDPLAKLRVGKIIFMSDPDPDGFHINALLVTLIQKYLPELFDRGMVYVANISEYYALDPKTKKLYSAASSEALAALLTKEGIRLPIKHIKGYGEVSADVLRYLAFDPATRSLSRVITSDNQDADAQFERLMAAGSEARKQLLGI